MRSVLYVLALAFVAAMAVWTYKVNYRTLAAAKRVEQLQRQKAAEQEAIDVLRVEWAWLNAPDRLRMLVADQGLKLRPMRPSDFADMELIAYPEPPELAPTAPPMGAVAPEPEPQPGALAAMRPDGPIGVSLNGEAAAMAARLNAVQAPAPAAEVEAAPGAAPAAVAEAAPETAPASDIPMTDLAENPVAAALAQAAAEEAAREAEAEAAADPADAPRPEPVTMALADAPVPAPRPARGGAR
ncbi:cell division protein FtsL [Rhodovulum sp. DZ06]|uniref:cell division protein FtsL n=1 Tax=Rhodovulum sp. DZ06 TaxID=3425126 RepID=UPI003D34F86F